MSKIGMLLIVFTIALQQPHQRHHYPYGSHPCYLKPWVEQTSSGTKAPWNDVCCTKQEGGLGIKKMWRIGTKLRWQMTSATYFNWLFIWKEKILGFPKVPKIVRELLNLGKASNSKRENLVSDYLMCQLAMVGLDFALIFGFIEVQVQYMETD